MIRLEKDFQAEFGRWMSINGFTCAYELKISRGNTVAFSKFEDQQIPSLWKAYGGIKHHKLTDASVGLKPFDGFCFKRVDSYVGIMFKVPENQKEFYLIHIKYVVVLKDKGEKSITKKHCQTFGKLYNF